MLRNYRLQNYNFKLVFNVLVLMAMSLLFIHSAKASYVPKQALGIIMGLGIIVVVSLIDYQVFTRNAEILYILNVIMLIGVKLFGKDVNGAKRWFSLGPLGTFQPSELSKVIMIIVVAAFLAKHQDDLNEPKVLGKLAVICGIPLLLILKQPSLSSTLDICFIILGMIFMAGLSSRLIVQVLIVGVPLLAIFLWYVQTPGGLFGKGFGSNTISNVSASDVNLVSENQTDFIFSVIGEEFGFVGCVVLIIVFACLVYQCMNVAKKSGNLIGTYVAVGVACYMGFQSFINIAVATGTMPNTGQPLPFISYGLSSLMSASIAIGMVLNIYLQRKRH